MRKKRYWVFGYDKYYPGGGISIPTKKQLLESHSYYVDIYDSLNDEMLLR